MTDLKRGDNWISVDDALPDTPCNEVLIWCGFIEKARYSDGDWLRYSPCCGGCNAESEWEELIYVTHWMPLPKMPEE